MAHNYLTIDPGINFYYIAGIRQEIFIFLPAVELNVAGHGRSRYGMYCDKVTDGTGHGLISTGNRKFVPRYDEFLSCGGEYVDN